MSFIQEGGPHKVHLYREVLTKTPINSHKAHWEYVDSFNAFVSPMTVEEVTQFEQSGKSITARITLFKNPGAIGKKHVFLYTNINHEQEVHEFNGFEDSVNAGRVFTVFTLHRSIKGGQETFPEPS